MPEHNSPERGRFERAVAALQKPVHGDDLAVQRIMRLIRAKPASARFRRLGFAAAVMATVALSALLWKFTSNVRWSPGSGQPSDVTYVQFVYVGPPAQTVSLVGSFNDWDPGANPLHKDGSDGVWAAEVPLRPGHHEYSFNVDGRWVPDDDAPLGSSDEFGVANSVIFVQ